MLAKTASQRRIALTKASSVKVRFSATISLGAVIGTIYRISLRVRTREEQTSTSHAGPTSSSLRGSDISFAAALQANGLRIRERGHVEILNLPVAKVKVSDREKAPVERTRSAGTRDAGDCGTGLGARIASGKGYK